MRRYALLIVIAVALLMLSFARKAHGQAADGLLDAADDQVSQESSDTSARIDDLDRRVSSLEGKDDDQAAARAARAQQLHAMSAQLYEIQQALALGQADV